MHLLLRLFHWRLNSSLLLSISNSIVSACSSSLLDTHSQRCEKSFSFASLFETQVLFIKAFQTGFDAPNVKSLLTRETPNTNWSWKVSDRRLMVWMERETLSGRTREKPQRRAHIGAVWKWCRASRWTCEKFSHHKSSACWIFAN